MIRAVLIDDESKGRKTLKNALDKYCHKVDIVGEAEGVVSGKELIETMQPELVFLDIDMKDGTGFDLLEKFQHFSFGVIFVTAHNEYAVKAFKCSAIDYLLKPVLPEELVQAISKFESEMKLKNLSFRLKSLIENRNHLKKLALATSEGVELLNIKDLIYCEASGNYTTFFTPTKQILVSKTIKEYDSFLTETHFYRIHQSYLVNLNFIAKYNKNDGGFVVLENGKKLPVSRRNKSGFLDRILHP